MMGAAHLRFVTIYEDKALYFEEGARGQCSSGGKCKCTDPDKKGRFYGMAATYGRLRAMRANRKKQ
jgi:hypothetical protein